MSACLRSLVNLTDKNGRLRMNHCITSLPSKPDASFYKHATPSHSKKYVCHCTGSTLAFFALTQAPSKLSISVQPCCKQMCMPDYYACCREEGTNWDMSMKLLQSMTHCYMSRTPSEPCALEQPLGSLPCYLQQELRSVTCFIHCKI